MRHRPITTWWLAVAFSAAAVGCQSAANVTKNQLVVRELRLQEDHIYELEEQLEQCEMENCALERENETLKQERLKSGHGADATKTRENKRPGGSSPSKLRTKPDEKEITPPPEVDFGVGVNSSGDHRRRGHGLSLGGSVMSDRIVKASHVDVEPEDPNVYDIAFNDRLTGALSAEAFNGRGGIMVVIEPRNAHGELVRPQGDISIVVMDPAETGKAQRVARWDFNSRQAMQYYKKTPLGTGYHFELPWSGRPPAHADLHVFARLTTPRGDNLTIDAPIASTRVKSAPTADTAIDEDEASSDSSADVARSNSALEVFGQIKKTLGKRKSPSADTAFEADDSPASEPSEEDAPRTVEKPLRTARANPGWRPER